MRSVIDLEVEDVARHVLEATPAVVYVYDVRREKSVYQNRSLADLLGHGPEVPVRDRTEWQHLVHPEDAARFPEYRRRLKNIRAGQTLSWEYRIRAGDGAWRWFQSRDVLLSAGKDGTPHLVVGNAADITDQKAAEHRYALLEAELRHRSKNFGAIVAAIARQTRPRDNPAAAEHFDAFVARLTTLLNAGDIVVASTPRMAPLHTILDVTLAPFLGMGRDNRITLDGPHVMLGEDASGAIALALHELATNAAKYGALSVANGRVSVTWRSAVVDGKVGVELLWQESDGPRVGPPARTGFGTRVIRQGAPGGRVQHDYRADGVVCRFEIPGAQESASRPG